MRKVIAALLLCVCGGCYAGAVTVVIPALAGSAADIAFRSVQQRLPFLSAVEYRPGYGGIVGMDAFRSMKNEGSVIAVSGIGLLVLPGLKNPEDFSLVTLIAKSPIALIAKSGGISDMILAVRSGVNVAVQDNSLMSNIARSINGRLSGKANIIPYKSSPQDVMDVAGGHVEYGVVQLSTALQMIYAGRVRLIAITGRTRINEFPDVPTLSEMIGGSYAEGAWGVQLPPKADRKIIASFEKMFSNALVDVKTQENLKRNFFSIIKKDLGRSAYLEVISAAIEK